MRLIRGYTAMMVRLVLLAAVLAVGITANAANTLTALSTFGGGDGYRAESEVLTGDTAGTDSITPGLYNYLQTSSLERGLAYNPVTQNLVLVSRSTAGNGIRLLNSSSGVDIGALNQGTGIITGGTFATSMVGVAGDGATYVANLQAAADTALYKVYKWADSLSTTTPTTFFGSSVTGYSNGVPRLGDSFDVTGSGASTTLVAGVGPNSGVNPGPQGYTVINSSGVATTVSTFTGATTLTGGDFRLGVTFAATANDVWGKQASQNAEFTSYSGSSGTSVASISTFSAGEAAMDYAVIGGRPILATLDTNFSGGATTATGATPFVRVYDVSNPAAPTLLVQGTSISVGTFLGGNGNGTGSIKFGAISGNTATIYAMTTNQGIQALTLSLDPVVAGVPGDYNNNGVVDAADYVLWRKGGPLQNEVDAPGTVNAQDYTEWRTRFGNPGGAGAGLSLAGVPEPATLLLALLGLAGCVTLSRNR